MKTIEYKVSYEKMISRIPGLFAYLESDELGNVSLHKATDSLDDCWGKIVENIKLPVTDEDNVNFPEGVSLSINEKEILEKGKVYSFRTLIDYYYQYREELGKEDVFVKFIERAIGKVEVPSDKKGEATPDFLYLSNVKHLYNELVKMDKECTFYEGDEQEGKKGYKDIIGKDKHLCCLCEKYKQMGGDGFKEYVGGLIGEAEAIAEEYKRYAVDGMTLDFDIDLTSTYQDLGIMTPYAPIWLPYKRYYKGDKVIYNNELYRCTKENSGIWDEKLLSVVFDEDSFKKVDNKMTSFDDDGNPNNNFSEEKIVSKTNSKLVDLRRFVTYFNDDGIAETPNGEDWLFYYRKGLVSNIEAVRDEFGNVVKLSDINELPTQEEASDLFAYGDVIEDIEQCTVDGVPINRIKFTYRIGAHLKGEGFNCDYDEDNNQIITWQKFVWDGNDKVGIRYIEEYDYKEGSDLDELLKGEFKLTIDGVVKTFRFADYINGVYDKQLPSFKFEFTTLNKLGNRNEVIAKQNVNIVSIQTNFEIYRKNFDEFSGNDLFRKDYYNGITYKPTKEIDVNIRRGSTSVFDKHLAFGCIKTFDDMQQYQNGSFFKMSDG